MMKKVIFTLLLATLALVAPAQSPHFYTLTNNLNTIKVRDSTTHTDVTYHKAILTPTITASTLLLQIGVNATLTTIAYWNNTTAASAGYTNIYRLRDTIASWLDQTVGSNGGGNTLQQVLTNGNIATNSIFLNDNTGLGQIALYNDPNSRFSNIYQSFMGGTQQWFTSVTANPNPIFQFGDNYGSVNGIAFDLDLQNDLIQMGDYNHNNQSTYMNLNDNQMDFSLYSNNGIGLGSVSSGVMYFIPGTVFSDNHTRNMADIDGNEVVSINGRTADGRGAVYTSFKARITLTGTSTATYTVNHSAPFTPSAVQLIAYNNDAAKTDKLGHAQNTFTSTQFTITFGQPLGAGTNPVYDYIAYP